MIAYNLTLDNSVDLPGLFLRLILSILCVMTDNSSLCMWSRFTGPTLQYFYAPLSLKKSLLYCPFCYQHAWMSLEKPFKKWVISTSVSPCLLLLLSLPNLVPVSPTEWKLSVEHFISGLDLHKAFQVTFCSVCFQGWIDVAAQIRHHDKRKTKSRNS